jgi:PAS domain S-box-containing protein
LEGCDGKPAGKIRESEERFLKIFYLSPVAQLITNLADGRVVNVNDSFLKLTEYTGEEVIGRSLVQLKIMAGC